ncbi:glutathione peroxidase, partial [Listeria monocytogenes]|nr:glutathione peroxidase [Listeria monocytogenes]
KMKPADFEDKVEALVAKVNN